LAGCVRCDNITFVQHPVAHGLVRGDAGSLDFGWKLTFNALGGRRKRELQQRKRYEKCDPGHLTRAGVFGRCGILTSPHKIVRDIFATNGARRSAHFEQPAR
jgi:hypothetical protein